MKKERLIVNIAICEDEYGEVPIYRLDPIDATDDNLASTTISGIRGEMDCMMYGPSGTKVINSPIEFHSIKIEFGEREDDYYGVNPSISERIAKCISKAFKVEKDEN